MRLLTFLARRFAWQPFARNLPSAHEESPAELPPGDAMDEALVAFVQCEPKDTTPEARDRVFRHALKHLKWHAGKRSTKSIVLHSFAHLGPETAPPDFADALLQELAARLTATGFTVACTPFGHTHAWTLDVHGEGNAKIWKEI